MILGWTVALYAMAQDVHHLEEHPTIIASAIDWLPLGDFFEGTWLKMGVAVDPLTAVMLIMVTFTVAMIFVYSVGYHNWGAPLGKISRRTQSPARGTAALSFLCLYEPVCGWYAAAGSG
ncbi:MAG: hypothetical protein M5U34_15980 [Chloroflexi bacterium]|nr:hypothetical protein [Chloroflexota bacterium]